MLLLEKLLQLECTHYRHISLLSFVMGKYCTFRLEPGCDAINLFVMTADYLLTQEITFAVPPPELANVRGHTRAR